MTIHDYWPATCLNNLKPAPKPFYFQNPSPHYYLPTVSCSTAQWGQVCTPHAATIVKAHRNYYYKGCQSAAVIVYETLDRSM